MRTPGALMPRCLPVLAVGIVPFLFACMGSGSGQVVTIDYSSVDGVSCMVGKGKNWTLIDIEDDYDASMCGPRTREGYIAERAREGGFRSQCELRWAAECCTQVGATHVGWQEASETASPLCKF